MTSELVEAELKRLKKRIKKCRQCSHQWMGRKDSDPVRCPNCNTRDWRDPVIGDLTCGACEYVWKPRVSKPKRCPRCQVWLNHDEA